MLATCLSRSPLSSATAAHSSSPQLPSVAAFFAVAAALSLTYFALWVAVLPPPASRLRTRAPVLAEDAADGDDASDAAAYVDLTEKCDDGDDTACDTLESEDEAKKAWLAKLDAPTWGKAAKVLSNAMSEAVELQALAADCDEGDYVACDTLSREEEAKRQQWGTMRCHRSHKEKLEVRYGYLRSQLEGIVRRGAVVAQ